MPSFDNGKNQKVMKMEFPIFVSCYTFNHAPYIEDTMNGFARQETKVPFICSIVDDASPDGTVQVIDQYLEQHFTQDVEGAFEEEREYGRVTLACHRENSNCWFLVIRLKENHYSKNKDKRPYYAEWYETAKYIAICEGDDYWIDSSKLETQYQFLEKNNEYNLIYSRVYVYNQTLGKVTGIHGRVRKTLYDRMMKGCFIPTCTILYRKRDVENYEKDIRPSEHHWRMGDIPLFLYLGTKGYGKMQKQITTNYRLLTESASHSKDVSKVVAQSESTRDVFLFFANKYFPDDQRMRNRIQAAHLYRVFRSYPIQELPEQYKKEIIEIKDNRGKTLMAKFIVKHPNTLKFYDIIAKLKMKVLMRMDKHS